MNTFIITADKVPALLDRLRLQRTATAESAQNARNILAKAAEAQSPENLLSIVEEIAIYETKSAIFNAFIPKEGAPDPDPLMLASRFVTLSLVAADATWSGTGNGLRLKVHAARIEALRDIRYRIFPEA